LLRVNQIMQERRECDELQFSEFRHGGMTIVVRTKTYRADATTSSSSSISGSSSTKTRFEAREERRTSMVAAPMCGQEARSDDGANFLTKGSSKERDFITVLY